ncbi:helix-turn-helix domain-containing protein, partial [Cupriavidus sp. SIMBA_020]|uniref:helix-turn-helix domain-containing protein n=1 Tax=Cupriavidus sp. SIMBA_020 TaxID=3085766 RepID=UPI00397C7454
LKAQGVSEREIARRLGISRNTVARYLSAEEVPRYKPREPRPTKLGAFEAYIIVLETARMELDVVIELSAQLNPDWAR